MQLHPDDGFDMSQDDIGRSEDASSDNRWLAAAEDDMQGSTTHAVSALNSQRIESLRAVSDDSTDMIGRRQTIGDGDAEDLEGRNAGSTRHRWRCSNLTLPSCVHKNDLCWLLPV